MDAPTEDPFQKLVAERRIVAEQKKAAAKEKAVAEDAFEKAVRNERLSSWQALQAAGEHANRMFAAVNSNMSFHFHLTTRPGSAGVIAGTLYLAENDDVPLVGYFKFLTNGHVNVEARTAGHNFVDNPRTEEADETYWRDQLLKYARAV